MAKNIKQREGFTIIEVVLVLAIAGLIFLMVFVALPTLRRSQRDTRRREDLSRVSAQLVQYQSNNNTKRNNLPATGSFLPTASTVAFDDGQNSGSSAAKFVQEYMNEAGATENTFLDPSGEPYKVHITKNIAEVSDSQQKTIGDSQLQNTSGTYSIGGTDPFKEHVIYIIPGGQCSGETVVKGQLRQFAILYRLEGAGTACYGSDSK